MNIFTRQVDLAQAITRAGEEVGFVPTMGALHAGHISLIYAARAASPTVGVSIFVNPTQFNDPSDLMRYPRTPESDLKMLEQAGVDWVYMPSVDDIYPEPDTRTFDFGTLDKVMEGAFRPGHFNGVAQIVSRLFEIVRPARAYFGEKDFQQLAIIRAMVARLDLPVEVVGCPIVRESDGLAMSSRNALLTPECRAAAPLIYKVLCEGAALAGSFPVAELEKRIRERIDSNPWLQSEYFTIVDAMTLQPIAEERWPASPLRGCVAVQAGAVRLIDNIDISVGNPLATTTE